MVQTHLTPEIKQLTGQKVWFYNEKMYETQAAAEDAWKRDARWELGKDGFVLGLIIGLFIGFFAVATAPFC